MIELSKHGLLLLCTTYREAEYYADKYLGLRPGEYSIATQSSHVLGLHNFHVFAIGTWKGEHFHEAWLRGTPVTVYEIKEAVRTKRERED